MAGRLIFTNKASNKGPVGNYIPGANIGPRSASVRRALVRRAAVRYIHNPKTGEGRSTYPCRNVICSSITHKENEPPEPLSDLELYMLHGFGIVTE